MPDDLVLLRKALATVERDARGHHWAKERPWRTSTHTGWEGDLLVVDLHDLGAGTAEKAVRAVVDAADGLQGGAVCFVVGRGRHSLGPAVLGEVVRAELAQACTVHGWTWRPAAAGRIALILDPARAPAAARPRLGLVFWLVAALLAAGLGVALARAVGWL